MITSAQTKCNQCKEMVSADEVIRFGDDVICSKCKETYVQRLREGVDPDPDLDELRRMRQTHLRHEASVRSMGSVHIISGALTLFNLTYVWSFVSAHPGLGLKVLFFFTGTLLTGSSNILVGYWFRKLDAKARVLGTIICFIGLIRPIIPLGIHYGLHYGLGFGLMGILGVAFNAYFLYLMNSAKGRMVMSPKYRKAREATPEMKCGASWIMMLVIAFIVFLAIMPFLQLVLGVFL